MATLIKNSEITALREMSARIGSDPLLVQGGTGNTSVKLDGMLWIKASGKWLAEARDQEWLVPVDLAEARQCVREDREIVGQYTTPSGRELNPSIETAMHAILPYRVVVHAHAVHTIAWSVRQDGPARVADRLNGLSWQWISYVASGIPLARAIEKVLAAFPDANVFVLANHGLVVCSDTCESAEELLAEVERRLATRPRPVPQADFDRLHRLTGLGWRLPRAEELHGIGTDPVSRRLVTKGVLYPCQAIFFGSHIPISRFHPPGYSVIPPAGSTPLLIVEGGGVLVNESISRAEAAVLGGLAQVLQRIDGLAPVRYLTEAEVADAMKEESYRERALLETA